MDRKTILLGAVGAFRFDAISIVVLGISAGAACMPSAVHGQIFVTSNPNDSAIVGEYTTSGATVNASLVSGLNAPVGIAVTGSDLFVANENADTIGEYTTSGATVNASLVSGVPIPYGIAVLPPGRPLTWNNAGGSGDGMHWDLTSQNWNDGTGPGVYADTSNVTFNDGNNGNYAVTLNTTVSPNSVTVNNSSGNYTISGSGSIAGTGSLTKSGTGTLTLSTANTYSGGTTVNAGTLVVGVNGALLNGNITINGGTFQIVTGGSVSAGLVSVDSGGSFNQTGGTNTTTTDLDLGDNSGSNGTYTLSGAASTLTVGGNENVGLAGAGTFNQSDGSHTVSGNLVIGGETGGTGNYTLGGGSLSAVRIYVGGSSAGAGGMGTFNQSGGTNTSYLLYLGTQGGAGAYTLSGTGSLSVGVIEYVGNGGTGTFNQTGGTNTAGVLSVGNSGPGTYSLSGTGSLSASVESVNTSGTFNQTGGTNTVHTNSNSSLGVDGTYTLSGTGSAVVANEFVGSAGAGMFIQSGGSQTIYGDLRIGAVAGFSGTYSLSGNGVLSVVGDGEIIGNSESGGAGGTGIFTQSGGTNSMSTLVVAGTYNLQGGALNLGFGPPDAEFIGGALPGVFNQSGGTNSLGGLTFLDVGELGNGTYDLSGTGSLSSPLERIGGSGGAMFLQTGGVNVTTELDLGEITGGIGTFLLNGGSLTAGNVYVGGLSSGSRGTGILGVSLTGQLSVTGQLKIYAGGLMLIGGGTSTVGSLSIDPGGKVVCNGKLFINYGSSPDPIASIAAWIAQGYAGGAWSGTGITSTAAQINLGYGIGFADSADPGNPANLPSGTIEIMYTLLGDANLDGTVNGTDFAILASNFNKAVTSWDQGDFNYDRAVNGSDFADLAANFNKGASQSADLAAFESFAAANGLLADVPEPGVVGLLLPMSYCLLMNRRRRVVVA